MCIDARTTDNLEIADPSAETRNLIARWRNIVKPGISRQPGSRCKKYHEQKFIRNERRIIEEQLQQAIRNIEGDQRNQPHGFLPPERQNEHWTVDRFWGVDRPQQLPQEDPSGPSTRNEQNYQECFPLEE